MISDWLLNREAGSCQRFFPEEKRNMEYVPQVPSQARAEILPQAIGLGRLDAVDTMSIHVSWCRPA